MQTIAYVTQEEYDALNSAQATVDGYTPLQHSQILGFDLRVDAIKAAQRPIDIKIGLYPDVFRSIFERAATMPTGSPLRKMVGMDDVLGEEPGMRVMFSPSLKIGRLLERSLKRGATHAFEIVNARALALVNMSVLDRAKAVVIVPEWGGTPGAEGKMIASVILGATAALGKAVLTLKQVIAGRDEFATEKPLMDIIHEEEHLITIVA